MPPAANAHRLKLDFVTKKIWDQPTSNGRFVTRILQVCPDCKNTGYRLIAKDRDAAGVVAGGSVCYFSKDWSDCETNMGEHYKLKAGSIKAFLDIADKAAKECVCSDGGILCRACTGVGAQIKK